MEPASRTLSTPRLAEELSLLDQVKDINPNACIQINEGSPIASKVKLTGETHLRGSHHLSSSFNIDPQFQGHFFKIKNQRGQTLACINASCHLASEEDARIHPKIAKSLDKSHAIGFETDIREENNSWVAKLAQRKQLAIVTGDEEIIQATRKLTLGFDITLIERIRTERLPAITYGLETDEEVAVAEGLMQYLQKAAAAFYAAQGEKEVPKSDIEKARENVKAYSQYSNYLRTGEKIPEHYFFDKGDCYVTYTRNRYMAKRIDQLLREVELNLVEKQKQDPHAKPALLHFFTVGLIHTQDFERSGLLFQGIPSILERLGWKLKRVRPVMP
jgi:hypothetical protein